MKSLIITILINCLFVMGQISPIGAEIASDDEALTVAKNWITLIIQKKGDWGGSKAAEVEEIQEFKRGERILGYFCHVKPRGFIVLSIHKNLAPVKAYSAINNLSPNCDQGMVDVIKVCMESVLDTIEQRFGSISSVKTEDLESILEINYRQTWEKLVSPLEIYQGKGDTVSIDSRLLGGEILLSSAWHQGPPYNDQCPDMNCIWDEYNYFNENAVVGCVATAGAQIMRYWNWPPYGVGSEDGVTYYDNYDWPNMLDAISIYSQRIQIDAIAELCHEVGKAADMDYGCDGSGCSHSDMQHAYEQHFRYSTECEKKWRRFHSAGEWFSLMQSEFDANRPIQYGVPGHSLVSDGWQILIIFPFVIKQYHMNYGWGGWVPPDDPDWNDIRNSNTWYTLDALPGCSANSHEMIVKIYPDQALGRFIFGIYGREPFPYRYFDRNVNSPGATFQPGQYLQFLPGIKVTCVSPIGGSSIQFQGLPYFFHRTFLFTKGDLSKGMRIYNGALKLMQNGSIKFY